MLPCACSAARMCASCMHVYMRSPRLDACAGNRPTTIHAWRRTTHISNATRARCKHHKIRTYRPLAAVLPERGRGRRVRGLHGSGLARLGGDRVVDGRGSRDHGRLGRVHVRARGGRCRGLAAGVGGHLGAGRVHVRGGGVGGGRGCRGLARVRRHLGGQRGLVRSTAAVRGVRGTGRLGLVDRGGAGLLAVHDGRVRGVRFVGGGGGLVVTAGSRGSRGSAQHREKNRSLEEHHSRKTKLAGLQDSDGELFTNPKSNKRSCKSGV